MGGDKQVEASGVGDERIHPKQQQGDRSSLNELQGSGRQDSRGETATRQGMKAILKEER